MDDTEIKDTLQRLAHAVVRNEIVNEYFMTQERPATVGSRGGQATARHRLGAAFP